MITRMLATLLLGVVYVLMLGSLDPRDALFGVAVGGVLVWWRSGGRRPPEPLSPAMSLRRAVAFVPFALAVMRAIVVGTWEMSLVVLRLRPHDLGGIIEVPMRERSHSGVVIQGLVETLSPGSVLVELDWTERLMLVHVMDATDPAAEVAERQEFYDRYQKAVFP